LVAESSNAKVLMIFMYNNSYIMQKGAVRP